MTAATANHCDHGRYVDDGEHCDECPPDERGPIHWPTFWSRPKPVDPWLCEPLVPRGRASHVFAPRGAGKSALLLAVAAGLATGRRVLDTPAGPGVKVAYVDREMTLDDLEERLVELGYGPDDDLSKLSYWVDPPFSKLDTELGGMNFTAWVLDCEAELVVVDSISRCIAGEENGNDTYDALYEHAIAPLKRAGVASLWAGNSGKDLDRGSRGGSRKEDVLDLIWRLERGDQGTVRLTATKRRSSWIPERLDLQRVVDDDDRVAYRTTNPSATLPAGSVEVARLLDDLDADLTISARAASDLLRENGNGRRGEVVRGAVKYRRWASQERAEMGGTRAGTRSPEHNGTRAGTQGPRSDF